MLLDRSAKTLPHPTENEIGGCFAEVLIAGSCHDPASGGIVAARTGNDNGVAERALRGVAVGRRNWLFAGSLAGGVRAAAIYSVIETCKANGVGPQAYIADVMAKLAAGWPAARWDDIMPWNWLPEPVRLVA